MKRQHHKIKQNTEEWRQLRLGRFTASSFKDLFMGKGTVGYKKAISNIVYEVLYGEEPESFSGNGWTERGHQLEPYAIEEYEIDTFNAVEPGGFWELGEWVGASPDGLIGDDGLFEGKAPAHNTQIAYLTENVLPKEYFWQVHGQLWVTDRDWCDFYTYHPKLPSMLLRVHRDLDVEKKLVGEIETAIDKVENTVELIRGKI